MKLDIKALHNEKRLPFGSLPADLQKQFRYAAKDACPEVQIFVGEWFTQRATRSEFKSGDVYRVTGIPQRMLLDKDDAPEGFIAEVTGGDGCGSCHLKPQNGLPRLCCPQGSSSRAQCSKHTRKDGCEVIFKEKARPEPWMKSGNKIRVVRVTVSGQECVLVVQNDITAMVLTPENAEHLGSLLQ